MNLRMLRKLKVGGLVALILMTNLICFMLLSLQGVITWHVSHTKSMEYFDTLNSNLNGEMPFSTNNTVNPLMRMKIDQMRRELNDSTLDRNPLLPIKRVGGYLLLNPNICKSVTHVDIVIIVHTAPPHFEKRQRIRNSFADRFLFQPYQIRVAFLLGKTSNKTLDKMLSQEHVKYNDIVMGDFTDHYHNLSLKGILGFKWVSQHCSNSKFVLKIDDDVLVNMFKLLYSFLNHMKGKNKSIFCNLWHKGTMAIQRRGKWRVESHIFSSREAYPYDYCSGFVVAMTTDLVQAMYMAAMRTPFFWIDDVYLFGMLPSVVGGVTFYNYALDRNITLSDKVAMNCTLSQGSQCPIFATYISDQHYWTYWDMIKEAYASTKWKVENKTVH